MTAPLIGRFPGLAELPRVGLAILPTPVDEREVPGFGPLLFKRDDLTSPLYGGNKVRKLEFVLGQALAEKRAAVLTFGAYGSNHALATAVHARALGLEPHVVLSPQAPGPFAAATLRAHAALGTVIHLVDGWDGRREAVRAVRDLAERDGIEPLVIPMGGTSPAGVAGYVNAAFELAEQLEDAPSDAIYVPGGTLGTALGLAIGLHVAAPDTRVVAVRVTPDDVANDVYAAQVVDEAIALLTSHDGGFPALSIGDLNFELRHDWFEPGYGVVTPETRRAVEIGAAAGIKLETTYTGKAFAALLADADSGDLPPGARVVFWDTYNSAPMPAPGPVEALPETLQDYVALCDELYGPAVGIAVEGDLE